MKSCLCGNETKTDSGSDNESKSGKETRKNKGRLRGAWSLFGDFSNGSTIHGVKYLGERHRHWSEKIFWIIAFLISASGCFLMIQKISNRLQYSPVVEENSTPVWHIPFPAVTICPETKVMGHIVNFTKAWHEVMADNFPDNTTLTDDELRAIAALTQVCDAHIFGGRIIDSSLLESEIVPLLREMAPQTSPKLS